MLLLILLTFWQYVSQDYNYTIEFTKIDNRAYVFVNDKQVFDSELVDGNPELEMNFDFTKFLKKGKNVVKIELHNGSELNPYLDDRHWTIRYEIFENNESYDYVFEYSSDGETSKKVFEQEHEIFIE
jgi:hypothetical protein